MNINTAFKNQDFWNTYENLYIQSTPSLVAEQWFNQLGKDFVAVKETRSYIETAMMLKDNSITEATYKSVSQPLLGSYEVHEKYLLAIDAKRKEIEKLPEFAIHNFEDKVHYYTHNAVAINFQMPLSYHLQLLLTVDLTNNVILEQTVYLMYDKEKIQLGCWDDSQWQPFFLKLEELKQLCSYWQKDVFWKTQNDIPFCLLSKFIGVASKEEKDYIEKRYLKSFNQLEVSSHLKIHFDSCYNWVSTLNGEEYVCVKPPKFIQNTRQNWNAETLKSLSYSFRKQNYGVIENYIEFPFGQWKKIMKQLSK